MNAIPLPEHPDAELLRLCAEHQANRTALHSAPPAADNDPRWLAYWRIHDAVTAAKPATMAGVMAKARIAKAEAQAQNSSENHEHGPAGAWAIGVVNDLLCLADADAEAIRLADAIMADEVVSTALFEAAETSPDAAARASLFATAKEITDRQWRHRALLAKTVTRTLDGFQAKARVAHRFNLVELHPDPGADDAVLISLPSDILGLPTAWSESGSPSPD